MFQNPSVMCEWTENTLLPSCYYFSTDCSLLCMVSIVVLSIKFLLDLNKAVTKMYTHAWMTKKSITVTAKNGVCLHLLCKVDNQLLPQDFCVQVATAFNVSLVSLESLSADAFFPLQAQVVVNGVYTCAAIGEFARFENRSPTYKSSPLAKRYGRNIVFAGKVSGINNE